MARTADVVIIGGGVTGCSIAFHLAERGIRNVVVLDETEVQGLYAAVGMSGHGFELSPAVGRMMADLIAEGRSAVADLREFRLDRFQGGTSEDSGAFAHSYLR